MPESGRRSLGRRSRAELKAAVIRLLASAKSEGHALPLHELKQRVWSGHDQYPGWATDLNEAVAGLVHDGVVWDDEQPSRLGPRSRSLRVLSLSGLALDRVRAHGIEWVVRRYTGGRLDM